MDRARDFPVEVGKGFDKPLGVPRRNSGETFRRDLEVIIPRPVDALGCVGKLHDQIVRLFLLPFERSRGAEDSDSKAILFAGEACRIPLAPPL